MKNVKSVGLERKSASTYSVDALLARKSASTILVDALFVAKVGSEAVIYIFTTVFDIQEAFEKCNICWVATKKRVNVLG